MRPFCEWILTLSGKCRDMGGILSFDRLAYANCELPGRYWDVVRYRLYDPATGKTERTLLHSRPGASWRRKRRRAWTGQPGEKNVSG